MVYLLEPELWLLDIVRKTRLLIYYLNLNSRHFVRFIVDLSFMCYFKANV